MKYYRLTSGLESVGKFIPVTENPYNFIDQTKDNYLSICQYTEDHKKLGEQIIDKEIVDKKTKKKKTIQRAKGVSDVKDVLTNKLVFDVDTKDKKEVGMDIVQKDAIIICQRLLEHGLKESDLNISYSGGKGFSIMVHHNKYLKPDEHKAIAKGLAGKLQSFDTTNYNASRIFRLDYTRHNKTNLYKTPITFEELKTLTIDKIKEKAAYKRKPKYRINQINLPDSLLALKPKPEKKESKAAQVTIDFSKKPYYLTDVKYALHKGFIPPGYGNTGMLILCATYKHVGFDMIDAYHMLKGVNEKRSEIYNIDKRPNDEIFKEVVEFVYSPQWKGGTFGKENELIQETCERFNINEKSTLVDINHVNKRFLQFAKNINKNVIKTGVKSLDEKVLITTGMMIGMLGAPSAGKTSFASVFVENQSTNGKAVLFESLDMYDNLLCTRLLQRQSGISMEKKLRKMIEDDPNYDPEYNIESDPEYIDAVEKVQETYGKVEFNFRRGSTIESIEEDIRVNKAKHGDNLKLVVVDYLEKVRGPYADATANSGYVSSRLSDLASMYDVALLLLLQPQKSAGDPSEELLSMRKVKGASVTEQDCRVILTMWRPGFSPKNSSDDKYATIAVVKNNMGEVLQLDYGWDGLKGNFNELTQIERDALESLRESIKEEKEQKNKERFQL